MSERKKTLFPLIIVLLIAVFFRFYNFKEFHYWSGDEEVLTATIRHIVWDRSPTLIVQNANLGFGLGPFYHYFLTPFYFISNFNLVALQAIASILGVVTTLIVYLGGKELGGRKLGLIAGFLYASSFLISLFDRRLVHLTLDPIMSALTFFLLAKVVKKDYRFLPLLAIPIGFSFHVDMSLMVLVIAIIITWIYFRFPLKSKQTLYLLLILGIFISPLVLAEMRYKGAVIKPIIKSFSDKTKQVASPGGDFSKLSPNEFINVLARTISVKPSSYIEEQFFYSIHPPLPLGTPVPQIIVALTFFSGFFLMRKSVNSKPTRVLWIMIFSFVLGILIYNFILKSNFYQHYYMVFFPVFILLLAQVVYSLYQKTKLLFVIFISVYFVINLYSLINSSVRYPLYAKLALVNKSFSLVRDHRYSVHASGNAYIHGGGWTELYNLTKHPPVKSYWYDFWGWIYASYSLYPGPVQQSDPERIISIYKEGDETDISAKIIASYRYKDLKIDVLDNSKN